MQLRVRLQCARIAELERRHAARDHLTVAEARELFHLREMEARRRVNRAWLNRGDNRQNVGRLVREWRSANPGCG